MEPTIFEFIEQLSGLAFGRSGSTRDTVKDDP